MSFVLDALRRAEAERQRGSVPGLHAQTLAAPSEPALDRRRPAWLVPAGAVLAAAAVTAWLVGGWRSPDAPAPAPAVAQAPSPAPAPTPAAAPSPVPAAPSSATPPAPVAPAPAVAPRPQSPRTAPLPIQAAPSRATAARPAPRAAPTGVETEPAAASKPAARAARVQRFQDLPDAVRRQIPPMTFGGATDSPDRSARMLLINGQIWREGDEPANGLRLERITLRSAVFLWREERFEVAY